MRVTWEETSMGITEQLQKLWTLRLGLEIEVELSLGRVKEGLSVLWWWVGGLTRRDSEWVERRESGGYKSERDI